MLEAWSLINHRGWIKIRLPIRQPSCPSFLILIKLLYFFKFLAVTEAWSERETKKASCWATPPLVNSQRSGNNIRHKNRPKKQHYRVIPFTLVQKHQIKTSLYFDWRDQKLNTCMAYHLKAGCSFSVLCFANQTKSKSKSESIIQEYVKILFIIIFGANI